LGASASAADDLGGRGHHDGAGLQSCEEGGGVSGSGGIDGGVATHSDSEVLVSSFNRLVQLLEPVATVMFIIPQLLAQWMTEKQAKASAWRESIVGLFNTAPLVLHQYVCH
jgi:hypothetical protein